MKYYARIESEKGKQVGTGGNEYLDIDIFVGNEKIAAFTLREGDLPEEDGEGYILYDENDEPVSWIPKKAKSKA